MYSSTTGAKLVRDSAQHRPFLEIEVAGTRRSVLLEGFPFTIGRRSESSLVIADPRVSRDHGHILFETGSFVLIDSGSKHGTLVNGQKIERHVLTPGDRINFASAATALFIYKSETESTPVVDAFLSQISSSKDVIGRKSDLEMLSLFLETARKLNNAGVLQEVLNTLLDATLRFTGAERGYVYLNQEGKLQLAAGRNSKGEFLITDDTISHSVVEETASGEKEFVITDTMRAGKMSDRQSIVAHDLRTVICIPLRRGGLKVEQNHSQVSEGHSAETRGVLYLDSRYASADLSAVSHDLLKVIATEAATLLENAALVQAEEEAKQYQKELQIAASIQQGLMATRIPEIPFARVRARNHSCAEVGGDFYDVVPGTDHVNVVIADVSGKGISAALLASILQGMIYTQLLAGHALPELAHTVNQFLCTKDLSGKYATLVIARLHATGELEYINCGHVSPILCRAKIRIPASDSEGRLERLKSTNLPIGLLPQAAYASARVKLAAGDRFIVVTDGATEASNSQEEFFGDARLEQAIQCNSPLDEIFEQLSLFRAGAPWTDDCTVLELEYQSPGTQLKESAIV